MEIKGLTKQYKNFTLNNISFSLEEGSIMGFIGPNGAGKTTTIKAILNQITRDAGDITLWGKDNIRHETELKNRIGVVLDEGPYYGHLTLRRMTGIIAPFYKNWNDASYRSYLREFELDDTKKVSELSKGMRMKYSIALALSHEADLLIMDEPTAGLDPLVREELLDILQRLIQDAQKAVFFSTHITSDLDKIADYIVLLDNGELVFNEPKDVLLETYAVAKGPLDVLGLSSDALFIGLRKNSYGFEALTKHKTAVRRAFGDRVLLEKPTVEDVMLYITRKDTRHAVLN
jgi:ABC-2 type transport system ATP-binding protein